MTTISETDHRRLSLIDFSSADDSLIANSFHQHSSDKFLTQNSTDEFDDAATKIHEWDREPRLNQIQNNLRQSLAWDTAFFNSPGVLEPEELSSMIKGVEKGNKRVSLLPAIQEDVHGSCESLSTFKSNNSNLTQESLEDVDLFQDVRASIQNFGRMSDLARANRNVPSRLQAVGSSTAVGMASCKKAPSSKSPSAGMQGPRKLPKKNPISPHLSRVSAARREEPCVSKHPKTLGNSSPSSTISSNRSSHGDLHVKSEKGKANKNNCGNSLMKTTVIKGSQVNELKSKTSSKSPLGPSVATKTKLPSPSSSSNLSRNISKSPLNSLKRKVDAGTKNSPSSSCSVFRTPPRIALRDKIGSSNSSLSGLSATKFSPSISPASSISNWSSESSSSTSTTKFRSNSSRTTLQSISNRKPLPEHGARHVSNSKKSQSGSFLERKETRDTGSIIQCVKAAAAGMVATPSPKKPLGLRQPSPKIGFFEGVKSSVRSPCGGMQPRTIAPQGSVSPSEGQNKAKLEKLQSPRSIISTKNKEFVNQKSLHLVPLNKSSDVKTSMALPHVESSVVAPRGVQNQMHLKPGVDNLDASSTMVERHICGEHDLNLGFTQGNSQYVDQVDCLSRQVKLMDINLKTQT